MSSSGGPPDPAMSIPRWTDNLPYECTHSSSKSATTALWLPCEGLEDLHPMGTGSQP